MKQIKRGSSLGDVHYCVNKNYPDGSLFCHTTRCFLKELEKLINILTAFLDFLSYLGAVSNVAWPNDF